MPEQTGKREPIAGWTLDTLKTYVESLIDGHKAEDNLRFGAQEKAMSAALAAAQAAIDKAERATHERFASVNEFRQALVDQTKSYVTRELHDKFASDVDRRLSEFDNWKSGQEGARGRGERTFNGSVALIGLLAAVATALATFALMHK